jgi:hypothetical protein
MTERRVTKAYTNDQRLLMEIRDTIEAIPLAAEIRESDLAKAKEIHRQLDAVSERIDRLGSMCMFLARLKGVDLSAIPDDVLLLLGEWRDLELLKLGELTEDELALLREHGALIETKATA